MKNKNSTNNFLLGTVVGGMVGGLAALLMAPQSGSETQQMILDKGDELRQQADEKVAQGKKFTRGKSKEAREQIASWLEAGSDLLENKSKEILLEKPPQPQAN